jgi:hypothetical protein
VDAGYEISRISHPELRVALFPPVSPVSLEQASAVAVEAFVNYAGWYGHSP